MFYVLLPLNGNDHRGVGQLHIQDLDRMYNQVYQYVLFSKPEYTTLLGPRTGVKIIDHTPILKLNQLNLLFELLFVHYYGFSMLLKILTHLAYIANGKKRVILCNNFTGRISVTLLCGICDVSYPTKQR